MAKDRINEYDATAGNNTVVGDVDIDEGNAPSTVNNAIRELMSHLKNSEAGTDAWRSITDSITAGSTQTQAGATALTTTINRITTSGTNGDGVKLLTATAGLECLVINDDSAQTIQVWPNTSDKIDGGSADAVDPIVIGPGESRLYTAVDATDWYSTVEKELITAKADTVITASDEIMFADATDSNRHKKDTVQGILDLVPSAPSVSDVKVLAFAASQFNKSGDSTVYTIQYTTEVFDTGSDFDGTSTFTAPETGKYLIIVRHAPGGLNSSHTENDLNIITSNRTYYHYSNPWAVSHSAIGDYTTYTRAVVADMDTSDTLTVTTETAGGSKVVDIGTDDSLNIVLLA